MLYMFYKLDIRMSEQKLIFLRYIKLHYAIKEYNNLTKELTFFILRTD